MSFVITMYVREGIVLASDSRLTLNTTTQQGDNQIVQMAVGQSDSNYKTFLANRIGISTFGAADVKGEPLGGHIEAFLQENILGRNVGVDVVPKMLLDYFAEFQPAPATQFHVAGYDGTVQRVWDVNVAAGTVHLLNPIGLPGASWGGEGDILQRLILPMASVNSAGAQESMLPQHHIPWQFFTMQDAIDFCIFAVRSTIDAIRFQPRAKTVGGPIDVLVIKPNEAVWVQRKELHA
ncbi:MAG: hypothetical protein SGJ05_09255 [bacterium]|nr:hypothetical protein [bacterium]